MSIVPPSNFWDSGSLRLIINGVLYAGDPLYITSNTIYIKNASATESGAVTTVAQSYTGAKTFLTSLSLANAHAVNEISNDVTLVDDSTTALTTEHAVKTYVDNSAYVPIITSVIYPLFITSSQLVMYSADIGIPGYMSALTQSISGLKSFVDGIRLSNAYTVSSISNDTTLAGASTTALPTEYAVKTYVDTAVAPPAFNPYSVLTANGSGAWTSSTQYVIDNTDAQVSKLKIVCPNGTKYTQVATDQLWNVGQFYTTAQTTELWANSGKVMSLDNTYTRCYQTTQSTSPTTGALVLDGGLGVAKDTYIAGQLTSQGLSLSNTVSTPTINTTGTVLPLMLYAGAAPYSAANTSMITINDTSSGGGELGLYATTSGRVSIKVSGGTVSAYTATPASNSFLLPVYVTSTSLPQLKLFYNVSNYATASVSSAGVLTLYTTGNEIIISPTDQLHITNTTASTSTVTGALTCSGGAGIAGAIYGATVTAKSIGGTQLTVAYDDDDYINVDVANGGAVTINASGSSISTNITPVIRILNQTEATNSSTGSINTAGGMSCAKSLYTGLGIKAGGNVQGICLIGSAVTDNAELFISDVGASGTCSATIITGGDTNLATSGRLLNNSNPIPSESTVVVNVTWGGVLNLFADTITIKKVGSIAYATFNNVYQLAVGTDVITSQDPLPAGVRPTTQIYSVVPVYYTDPVGSPYETQAGLFWIDSSYYINFLSSTSKALASGREWPNGWGCGWLPFTTNWFTS